METPFDKDSSILSKLTKMFSFRNATTKILLKYHTQCEQTQSYVKESDETAVSELIKILKKRKGSVEELLNALSQPDQPSKCVTIPTSDDRHFQVYDGIEKPHVKCCRLWRWPDLSSHHQITPIAMCMIPFESRQKEVCINPYHYKLREEATLPSVRVPYQYESGPISTIPQVPVGYENICSNSTISPVGYGNICSNSTISPVHSTSDMIRPNSISPYSSISTPDTLPSSCSSSMENVNQQTDGVQICYEEFYNWAKIAYYELSCRIGDIFQCNTNKVTVDGYTNPRYDAGRFCLGQLSNVTRNSSIEHTRQHIGRGLELIYVGGRVYAENKSNASIFIQSRNSNLYHNFDLNTVCKLPPSCSLCIFNNQYFAELLTKSVYDGFECVYNLTNMCTIRISFVKGWGAEYFRQDVTSTPCWIEIHLSGPLGWLDKVLTQMGSPNYAASSVSYEIWIRCSQVDYGLKQLSVAEMYWIAHLDGGPCRVNHTAVVVGDFIYSFGGYCSSEEYKLNHTIDVHVLNTHNLRWFLIPPKRDSTGPLLEYPEVPFQRYGHSAVAYKQKVYMWGGRNDEMCCSILFCFDTTTHQWSKPAVNGEIPAVRDGHTACIVDHNMYIFGGFEEQANRFSCDVHCLNLETMTWSYLTTSEQPPSYRDFHTATVLDNKMYIFGGRGDRHSPFHTQEEIYCDQLVYLDLNTRKWTKPNATGSVPLGRRSHSAFVYNKQLYVFGGYNSIMEKHFNDLYCYNPALNRWNVVAAKGVPPRPRRRQVCLVIDKRMYLFGGTSPYGFPIHSSNRQNIPQLLDYSDIHVFDFEPTLKTLAIRAVLDYDIDQTLLPQCISGADYLKCIGTTHTKVVPIALTQSHCHTVLKRDINFMRHAKIAIIKQTTDYYFSGVCE